jgi:hypothetical protein
LAVDDEELAGQVRENMDANLKSAKLVGPGGISPKVIEYPEGTGKFKKAKLWIMRILTKIPFIYNQT